MNKQVMIRKPLAHGNVTKLIRASVISETNGMLRVLADGDRKPIDVKRTDVVAAPARAGERGVAVPTLYPHSLSSLANRGQRIF